MVPITFEHVRLGVVDHDLRIFLGAGPIAARALIALDRRHAIGRRLGVNCQVMAASNATGFIRCSRLARMKVRRQVE